MPCEQCGAGEMPGCEWCDDGDKAGSGLYRCVCQAPCWNPDCEANRPPVREETMTDDAKTEDPMVAALLREREGYAQRGMDDRVALVDEQLALRGYTPPDEAPAGQTGPVDRSTPPRGRRSPGQDKA